MKYKLKEICLTVTDGSHYSPQGQDDGFPMLSVKDMLEYGFDYTNCKRISEDDFIKMKSSGCVPQKNDVLVAKDGSYLKEIFVCKENKDESVLSSIAIFRPNDNIVNPFYLCYLLKSPRIFNYISSNCVSGSALPRIVLKAFKEVEMEIPCLDEQEKVVSVLKSIDNKIQTNNKINKNLEEQAFAIFRSWFVDFEPSGGTIPANWNMSTLSNVSEIGAGGDKPPIVSEQFSEDCPYPIYSNGISNEGLYGYTDNAKIFDESISVSARGTIGFVCLRHIPYVPIVRLITLIPDKQKITAKYLYCWLKSIHIAGTGTTQQQLTVPQFKSTEILIPDANAMTRFTDITDSLFNKIWSNQDENMRLASLRDTLLPRLISGELDVSDIDI